MFNDLALERFRFSIFGATSPFIESITYIVAGDEPVSHTINAQVTRNPMRVVDGQGESDIWVELSAADLAALGITPVRGKDRITLQPHLHDPATRTYVIQKIVDQDIASITLGLNR